MLLYINNNKKLFVLLYFLLLYLIGIIVFADYGISIDEDNTRINGFISLKYVFLLLVPEKVYLIDQHILTPDFSEWGEHGVGVIFDLPLALIELLFNIDDIRNIYLLRHFLNFTIFFISIYFFYLIIKKRFNSWFFAIFASALLFFTPRIFAQSFYNSKDIIFLSFFVISIYYSLSFLDKKNYKNAIKLSFFTALAIDVRILGVVLPLLVISFYLLNIFESKNFEKKNIKPLVIYILLLPVLVILFYPYLWEAPLQNFINVFKDLSQHNVDVYNFYLGKFVYANDIPWHYPFVWFFVSTPILYIVPFFLAFFYMIYNFLKRINEIEKNNKNENLWKNNNEMFDLFFLLIFISPIIPIILIGSTLYDGWRHLYFIYPCFLIISLYGFDLIKKKIFRDKINYFYIVVFIFCIPHIAWMYKNHPYQNVFFNSISKNIFHQSFELDYWGLSNKNALEKILEKNNKKIKIYGLSTADLDLSKKILKKNNREKIEIVYDINNADYVIDNHRDWRGKTSPYNKKILEGFNVIHEIYVDNFIINTIYKKNDNI